MLLTSPNSLPISIVGATQPYAAYLSAAAGTITISGLAASGFRRIRGQLRASVDSALISINYLLPNGSASNTYNLAPEMEAAQVAPTKLTNVGNGLYIAGEGAARTHVFANFSLDMKTGLLPRRWSCQSTVFDTAAPAMRRTEALEGIYNDTTTAIDSIVFSSNAPASLGYKAGSYVLLWGER